ncbi:chorismate-binding protein, partial [bacterium]|nr:chorismate-binding protein [bacterium]
MVFATQGTARFSTLQAAFSGLQPVWRDDDSQQTGVAAAAHIGFAFEDEGQADLPNAQLCVPAILLQNRAGRGTATFSCAVRDADNALARWRAELQNSLPASHAAKRTSRRLLKPNAPIRTLSPLNDRAFLARAHAALHDIAAGCAHFESADVLATTALLATLARRHAQCTIYGVGQPGGAFVGATPEHLVSLHKGFVRADALAGTAWLSATSDSANTGSLTLQGNKNSYEQQLVVD